MAEAPGDKPRLLSRVEADFDRLHSLYPVRTGLSSMDGAWLQLRAISCMIPKPSKTRTGVSSSPEREKATPGVELTAQAQRARNLPLGQLLLHLRATPPPRAPLTISWGNDNVFSLPTQWKWVSKTSRNQFCQRAWLKTRRTRHRTVLLTSAPKMVTVHIRCADRKVYILFLYLL